ncbi:MAG: hypothetical protein RMJ31_01775 [Nitrososphaerota archaeon]|nr:hypothetical protein [Nitrososphaerales archaeon]MDW8044489.1 hypothetical protein [Nitrososphaerota archaeon]
MRDRFIRAFSLMIILTLLILISFALQDLPPYGNHPYPLGEYFLRNTLNDTGAMAVVNAILWDYRGYDTLGETTVLFTAIVVVLTLLRMRR